MLQSIKRNTRNWANESFESLLPFFTFCMIFRIIQTWSGLYVHICETNCPFLVYQCKKILSLLLHTNLKIGDDVSTVILNCPSSLMSFFKTVPPNSLLSIFCLKQEEWMDEWVNKWNTITSLCVKKLLETLLKWQCSP